MPNRQLILGAARSGKTRHALALAGEISSRSAGPVTYVATAQALDDEMAQRIRLHRAERPAAWQTVEASADLAGALSERASHEILVVDCLTLWLSKAMIQDFQELAPAAALPCWQAECDALLGWLARFQGTVVFVSNEVGGGIVPVAALARRFQDEQGRLNQAVAALCERVTLVVAGLPLVIKS